MSAVPEDILRADRDRANERRRRAEECRDVDTPLQRFLPWFALAALAFCWIAEATMCAERGF